MDPSANTPHSSVPPVQRRAWAWLRPNGSLETMANRSPESLAPACWIVPPACSLSAASKAMSRPARPIGMSSTK